MTFFPDPTTHLDMLLHLKGVHKTTTTDDKRLQSTLKKIGVNWIQQIEEVNIFKDETVIQFLNPKVQTSIPANTWVVSGTPQIKSPDNMDNLRKLAEQFQKRLFVCRLFKKTTTMMSQHWCGVKPLKLLPRKDRNHRNF